MAQRLTILVAATLLTSVTFAAVVFLVRRLSGDFVAPLPTPGLILCGVLLAATVAALRIACEPFVGRLSAHRRRIVNVFVPASLVLLVAAVLSLPGSSAWGLIGLWGFAAASEALLHRVGIARRARARPTRRLSANPVPTAGRNVWQRLTRLYEPDGADVVEGWLRADLPAGTRTTQVHIAFCPPFTRTPIVEAEQQEGPPATLKVGPIYPHGARVEIRLDRAVIEPASVAVAVSAREKRG